MTKTNQSNWIIINRYCHCANEECDSIECDFKEDIEENYDKFAQQISNYDENDENDNNDDKKDEDENSINMTDIANLTADMNVTLNETTLNETTLNETLADSNTNSAEVTADRNLDDDDDYSSYYND